MRIPFVLAVANNMGRQIVNAVDELEFIQGGSDLSVHYDRLIFRGHGFMVAKIADGLTLPWTSAGVGGFWEAWLLVPEDFDWRLGPAAQRKLRRAFLLPANQNGSGEYYLQGPWSLPHIAELRPVFAEAYLQPEGGGALRSPAIFWGDPAPEAIALVDYRPSDADCINDVEPEAASLGLE